MTPEEYITDKERGSANRTAPRTVLGLALLAPAILCWISGLVVPTLNTLITSLQKADLLREAQFIGLENYTRLFQDKIFSSALGFTLLLIVVRVLVVSVVPLLLAVAVNEFGRGVRILVRLLFTIPLALFAPVATALIWTMALNPNFGLANSILQSLNQAPQHWLSEPEKARQTLLLVDGLTTFGLACGVGLVFYLAALRGAGEEAPSQQKVSVPLIASWVTGLLATIALTLPSFTLGYVLTRGGPASSTMTLGILQFIQAFQYFKFGAAAAVAALPLIVTALLGLIVGLIVVLARLRLEMVPLDKQSGLLSREGKTVAAVLLALTLLGSLGICSLSVLPLPWTVLSSLKTNAEMLKAPSPFFPSSPSLDAYTQIGKAIPIGRVLVNTILPLLVTVFLFQIPIAYIGALGIGAVRPFGKRSELLLLPFSPWLFVTIGPLSIAAFKGLRAAGLLDTLAALPSPILLSVPMLFILTLFFKGQEPKWRAARAEGQSAVGAFFTKLILPSLPLVALLACAAILIGLQDLLWPLLATKGPKTHTISLALLMLRSQSEIAWPTLAAALTLFGLPTFVFFFLAFGTLQSLYLDRLSLGAHLFDAEE